MAIYLHLILTYTRRIYAKNISRSRSCTFHTPKSGRSHGFDVRDRERQQSMQIHVVDYMLTFLEDMSDVDDFEVSKNWLVFFSHFHTC